MSAESICCVEATEATGHSLLDFHHAAVAFGLIVGEGHIRIAEKAQRVLGWTPRSNEEAIVATATSLVRLGLLRDSPKKAA